MRVLVLGFVLAAAALAGCTGAGDQNGESPVAPPDLAALYEFEHDHADPLLHDLAWNVETLAFHPLTDDGTALGIAGEIDVARDIAAVHFEGARSGFAVLNVSDPTRPVYVGWGDAEAFRPWEGRDVKLDPRAEYAYFAMQHGAPTPPATVEGAPVGGFLVFSLEDPANPRLVAQAPEVGRGCHMIRYWESGEDRIVYCSSTQGLTSFRLVDGPQGPRTPVKAGVFVPNEPETTAEGVRGPADPGAAAGAAVGVLVAVQPHDMTAQADPLTGEPILVAAYEHYGIRVLDIAQDPTQPTEVGAWEYEGANTTARRMHTALMTRVGDRRVAVGALEAQSPDDVTALFLVDFTDLAAPLLLAEWSPPGVSHGALFSTHNVQVVGTTLYMAHFHGGLRVFDISDPTAPRLTGAYAVTQALVSDDVGLFGGGAPMYWDVVVRDGYMLVSDMPSGLVVLHHAGDPIGDPAWDSFV